MNDEVSALYAELERAPEDWSVRLRLIEAAVAGNDLDEAKRLVRTSPEDDQYLPAELQDRIHMLLTGVPPGKGAERVVSLTPDES